jgi:hypothetical protein
LRIPIPAKEAFKKRTYIFSARRKPEKKFGNDTADDNTGRNI